MACDAAGRMGGMAALLLTGRSLMCLLPVPTNVGLARL
jgi:hypothetical protein